jgi:hypothetical protein
MKLSTQENLDISKWLSGVNPQENTNWVKVKTLTFNGTTPSGSFDISNCTKFMIETQCSASSAAIYAYLDTDQTAANYKQQAIAAYNGSSVGASQVTSAGINLSVGTPSFTQTIFDKTSKCWYDINPIQSAGVLYAQTHGSIYLGSAVMNTLTLTATAAFTGTITVYKWQDIKVTNLATYELIGSYTLNNTTLNQTIAIDGESTPNIRIVSKIYNASGAFTYLWVRPNGDSTYTNYFLNYYGHNGSTLFGASDSQNASYTGLLVGGCDTAANSGTEHWITEINLKTGSQRLSTSTMQRYRTNATDRMGVYGSRWANTSSAVTSLQLITSANCSGTVEVYRLVTQQLLKQNTKPIELVHDQYYTASTAPLTIDFSDCDSLEIVCDAPNANAASIGVQIGADVTAANYARNYFYSASSALGGRDNARPSACYGGASHCITKFFKYSKTIVCNWQNGTSSSDIQTGQYAYRYNGPDTSTTITLTPSAAFTGKIKVYKKY